MAKIISVSLSEKLLQEIDQLKEETGFSGRSDVIRASTRMLIADNQKSEDKVTEIKHDFEDIIETQIHTHLKEDKCLELFILEGDADRMNTLTKMFQTTRKIEYVKLITI